jgi:hypothetical protein
VGIGGVGIGGVGVGGLGIGGIGTGWIGTGGLGAGVYVLGLDKDGLLLGDAHVLHEGGVLTLVLLFLNIRTNRDNIINIDIIAMIIFIF